MNRGREDTLQSGVEIGRYRVVERIGGGGMGDVYRARDLDLDRDVALKVLPADVVGDEDRVRRFVQEAKAASSLNHPHIVTVYEIGKAQAADGAAVHYISMELIDGETLRTKIKTSRDLKPLLGYAAQAADALAKAHAAGIVHRDLKPDNLMVTRDGFAKVLDFGLAKLTERSRPESADGPTEVMPQTREGLVMGTVGYMSPEQAEGQAVDHRSDIFSFGCILYEIATKQRPFTGKSEIDVLHAIIHDEPAPITNVNPSAPSELRRIVRRCLAKDPDQRIQSMKDLANTIRDLLDEYDQLTPGSGSSAAVAAQPPPRSYLPWITTAIAVVAAVILGIWALSRRQQPAAAAVPGAEKAPPTMAAITTTGKAANGSLSPDGRYIAYNVQDRDKVSVRVRQLATGAEVELFPPSAEIRYQNPQYSRDGEYLYLLRAIRGSSVATLVSVPTIGGQPREIVRDVDWDVTFSPDGKRIAFTRTDAKQSSICIADSNGGNERVAVTRTRDMGFSGGVSWSPSGEWIAAPHRGAAGGLHSVLLLISPDGKKTATLGRDRWFFFSDLRWLPDMSGLLVTGQREETGIHQVWLVSYPDGTARRLTSDFNSYFGISLTPDAKSALVGQGERRGGIWKVDVENGSVSAATDSRLRHVPTAIFSVDASGRIYYHSTEAGTLDVWVFEPDGSTKTQLTSMPGAELTPSLSPDGTRVYYQSETPKGLELHEMRPDGTGRRVVTALPSIDAGSQTTPDGKAVILSSTTEIFFVPLDGGARRKLDLPPANARIAVSPDGRWIAGWFRTSLEEGRRLQMGIFPVEGGKPVRIFERATTQYSSPGLTWTGDGKNLVYVDNRDGAHNLWLQPADGGAPRPLTKFTDEYQIGAIVTGPNNTIYVSRALTSTDLVKITNFR